MEPVAPVQEVKAEGAAEAEDTTDVAAQRSREKSEEGQCSVNDSFQPTVLCVVIFAS